MQVLPQLLGLSSIFEVNVAYCMQVLPQLSRFYGVFEVEVAYCMQVLPQLSQFGLEKEITDKTVAD